MPSQPSAASVVIRRKGPQRARAARQQIYSAASQFARVPLTLDTVLDLVRRTAVGTTAVDVALGPETGIDSLNAVELRNELQAVLSPATSLPSTIVFDHPTARRLALALGSPLADTDALAVSSPRRAETYPISAEGTQPITSTGMEQRIMDRLEALEASVIAACGQARPPPGVLPQQPVRDAALCGLTALLPAGARTPRTATDHGLTCGCDALIEVRLASRAAARKTDGSAADHLPLRLPGHC